MILIVGMSKLCPTKGLCLFITIHSWDILCAVPDFTTSCSRVSTPKTIIHTLSPPLLFSSRPSLGCQIGFNCPPTLRLPLTSLPKLTRAVPT